MQAYCPIEDRITIWRKIENGKWVCTSSQCSMAAGQHKIPPKTPIRKEYNPYRLPKEFREKHA